MTIPLRLLLLLIVPSLGMANTLQEEESIFYGKWELSKPLSLARIREAGGPTHSADRVNQLPYTALEFLPGGRLLSTVGRTTNPRTYELVVNPKGERFLFAAVMEGPAEIYLRFNYERQDGMLILTVMGNDKDGNHVPQFGPLVYVRQR